MIYMFLFSFCATILSTFLGGLIAIYLQNINKEFIKFLNNFSLGAIVSFLFLELFKESIELFIVGVDNNILGSVYSLLIIVGVGLLFYISHELIHHFSKHHHHDNDDKLACLDHAHIIDIDTNKSILTNAVFLLAIFIHNIPEGLSLGMSFILNNETFPLEGLIMSIVLFLHNLIIGYSLSSSLKEINKNKLYCLFTPLITALIAYIFAIVGYFVSNININDITKGAMLSVSTGSLLYVLFIELIPQSYYQYKSKYSFIYIILGLAITAFLLFI